MKRLLIVSTAALLAGTTYVSAQVSDNPPGYEPQRRGVVDGSGRNPERIGNERSYASSSGSRNVRRDDPPGSRFQDRGNYEDMGIDPLR